MNKLSIYQTAYMKYPYSLPPLDYEYDALEPHIDAQTMHLHHDKHHQAYIDHANEAVGKYPELQSADLVTLLAHSDQLPAEIRTTLQSNGGGHLNHSLFWQYMTPRGGGEPQGKLAQAITKAFGGFAQFKAKFDAAAKNLSGSGWVWLFVTSTGDLETGSTANQDTPLSNGQLPILALDVWEHAYYLKYHNQRPEYVSNWWHVLNWKKVQEQFDSITA
jgi:Fe-Mn family superoxide dismutase